MRFQAEQTAFASALQTVARAVSTRTTLPILTGILLQADDQQLTIAGTDLEISLQARVPADVLQTGSVVLPARYLTEYVRRIPPGPIEVSVESGTQQALLTWGRSEYRIHGFPAEQYPRFDLATPQQQVAFPASLLFELVQQTAFAVSSDETRPTLTGVNLKTGPSGLLAIATDGFRVAIRQEPAVKHDTPIDVILPGRALAELQRLLSRDQDELLTLGLSEQQARIEIGEIQLATRLIEGQYPNVLDLLPDQYPLQLETDRLQLMEATERTSLLADSRLAARLVVLDIEPDHLKLTSQDPEVGQAYEEVPIVNHGGTLQIGFNARYLIEGLRHIESDVVRMELIDAVKAVRISAKDDDRYHYIVFPVRL